MKECAPPGSNLFPFRIDLFAKSACCAAKQTRSHKNVSLVKSEWKWKVYLIPLFANKELKVDTGANVDITLLFVVWKYYF